MGIPYFMITLNVNLEILMNEYFNGKDSQIWIEDIISKD